MALPTRDEWLDYCQSDPLFFPTKVLGLDLWEKQVEIIRAIHEHERVAVQACHSASKTHTAAALTLSFLFSYFPSKVITTSAQKGQVRYALWNEIRSQIRNARLPLCPKECITVMSLNLAPDWFAIGLKPQEYNPEAFQGFHSSNVLIIFDEASGIPAPLWEAAEGLMTHAHCRFLAIGNPFDPLSTFGEVCNSPMWHRIKISAWDTPNVKAGRNIRPELMAWDWPEKMRKEWGEQDPRYYARVLGEFPETDSTLLIPPSKARAVLDRKPLRSDDYPVVIGLDPSGYGPDKNVWVVRQGLTILDIQWVAKATDEALAKRTKDLVDKWHASIVYVDGGWGKGVFDHLVRMGVRVRLVHLSQPSSRPDVQNLKTEAALKLRQAVDSGLALGPAAKREAQNWVADIAAPKLTVDPRTERQKLEDKRSLRSRLGRSPDFLDATLLTFVHADTSEWKPFELVVEREAQEGEHRPFGASQRSFSGRWQRPEFYFRRSLWLDRERGFA